jgi:hypothetical protein
MVNTCVIRHPNTNNDGEKLGSSFVNTTQGQIRLRKFRVFLQQSFGKLDRFRASKNIFSVLIQLTKSVNSIAQSFGKLDHFRGSEKIFTPYKTALFS